MSDGGHRLAPHNGDDPYGARKEGPTTTSLDISLSLSPKRCKIDLGRTRLA